MHIVITGSIFNPGNCEAGTKVCLEPQADGVFREGKIIASCYSGCLCDFLMLPGETSDLVPLLFCLRRVSVGSASNRGCWVIFLVFFLSRSHNFVKDDQNLPVFFAITRCLVFRTKTKLGEKSQRRTVSVGFTWKKKTLLLFYPKTVGFGSFLAFFLGNRCSAPHVTASSSDSPISAISGDQCNQTRLR